MATTVAGSRRTSKRKKCCHSASQKAFLQKENYK
ncbi:hypothetical protein, partial [Streptococcus parasuis]